MNDRIRGRGLAGPLAWLVVVAVAGGPWMSSALAQPEAATPPAATAVTPPNAQPDAQPEAQPAEDVYLRVLDRDDGQRVVLEAAVREFRPASGQGPVVYLAAAIHIADKPFYESLQKFLDTRDVVLFEGVKPPGAGGDAALQGDEAKARSTVRRIRFVAMALEAYKREHGGYPADLAGLAGGVGKVPAAMIERALKDLWGHDLIYTLDPEGAKYDIVSLGADGAAGGEGSAADLKLSDQKPLTKAERGAASGGGGGIQQQMADAMGLTFQLTAMDHGKPNWRNSDMSIDQVQERLEKTGAGGEQLFKLLDGSSMVAKLASFFFEIIKASPSMQTMMKLMMVELLGRADELMVAQAGEKMMDVLIKERNIVVMDDLKRIIQNEPGVKTVGIIYGGGHLPDMQRRLKDELGYEPAGVVWSSAIEIDLAKAGLNPQQARQLREMFRKQIEQQLKKPKPRD